MTSFKGLVDAGLKNVLRHFQFKWHSLETVTPIGLVERWPWFAIGVDILGVHVVIGTEG